MSYPGSHLLLFLMSTLFAYIACRKAASCTLCGSSLGMLWALGRLLHLLQNY